MYIFIVVIREQAAMIVCNNIHKSQEDKESSC